MQGKKQISQENRINPASKILRLKCTLGIIHSFKKLVNAGILTETQGNNEIVIFIIKN